MPTVKTHDADLATRLVDQAGEILAHRMLTLHNVTFYQTLMSAARAAIERGAFDAFADAFRARYRDRAG